MGWVPGVDYRYFPDGLDVETLDELIGRAYAEAAKTPGPTSALLDGTAAEPRRRRMERRAVARLTGSDPRQGRSAALTQLAAMGSGVAGEVA